MKEICWCNNQLYKIFSLLIKEFKSLNGIELHKLGSNCFPLIVTLNKETKFWKMSIFIMFAYFSWRITQLMHQMPCLGFNAHKFEITMR